MLEMSLAGNGSAIMYLCRDEAVLPVLCSWNTDTVGILIRSKYALHKTLRYKVFFL